MIEVIKKYTYISVYIETIPGGAWSVYSGFFNNEWFIRTIVVIELHPQSPYSKKISA